MNSPVTSSDTNFSTSAESVSACKCLADVACLNLFTSLQSFLVGSVNGLMPSF